METHHPDPARARPLRLRGPDDVLAAVPVLLGFEPTDSLVVLTFAARPGVRTPHLRVDLPEAAALVRNRAEVAEELVDVLVEPCVRHGVDRVLVVHYTADADLAERLTTLLGPALAAAGIDVASVLRADGTHWQEVGSTAEPEAYRAADHTIRAEAVLRGEVVHRSRAHLARTLDPVEGPRVDELLAAVRRERRRARTRTGAAEAQWVAQTVPGLVDRAVGRAGLPHDTVARLLLALEVGANRDAAWRELDRGSAQRHHELWARLTRESPAGLRAAPAALAALTAWLRGHGALAWCAVDVCLAEAPHHGLGCLVRDLLASATAPSWWDDVARSVNDGPA